MTNKLYKETFEKISEEKRERIIDAALSEFASKGFTAANINVIAKNAEISIGSMYNYFASKEDLFLTLFEGGYAKLEEALSSVDLSKGDIFDKFEKLSRVAQEYSRKSRRWVQLYQDCTSEGIFPISKKLSRNFETITAKYYKSLLEEAKEQGVIDKNLDNDLTSFCIDNLVVMVQYSYASEYFKERMKVFAGEDAAEDDEKVINGIMRFIRGALSPMQS